MLQIQFSFFFGPDCFAEGVNAVCMLAMLSAAWYEQPDVCDGPRPRYFASDLFVARPIEETQALNSLCMRVPTLIPSCPSGRQSLERMFWHQSQCRALHTNPHLSMSISGHIRMGIASGRSQMNAAANHDESYIIRRVSMRCVWSCRARGASWSAHAPLRPQKDKTPMKIGFCPPACSANADTCNLTAHVLSVCDIVRLPDASNVSSFISCVSPKAFRDLPFVDLLPQEALSRPLSACSASNTHDREQTSPPSW